MSSSPPRRSSLERSLRGGSCAADERDVGAGVTSLPGLAVGGPPPRLEGHQAPCWAVKLRHGARRPMPRRALFSARAISPSKCLVFAVSCDEGLAT